MKVRRAPGHWRPEAFASQLLKWFRRNRRAFPWRSTRDPYKVLIAEFMLQRTGALQTVPVYRAFARTFPSLKRARAASDRALAEILEPLGRTGRVHQLREALETIACEFGGKVPAEEEALLRIPGVGRYTARAVLTFAFGQRYGLFDPNIARVLKRAFGTKSLKNRPHTDPSMWKAVMRLLPQRKVKEFNWALLDLAVLVCKPRNPRCGECPVAQRCLFYRDQRAA